MATPGKQWQPRQGTQRFWWAHWQPLIPSHTDAAAQRLYPRGIPHKELVLLLPHDGIPLDPVVMPTSAQSTALYRPCRAGGLPGPQLPSQA